MEHAPNQPPKNPNDQNLQLQIAQLKEQLQDLRLERESFIEDNPPPPVETNNQPRSTQSRGVNTESSS